MLVCVYYYAIYDYHRAYDVAQFDHRCRYGNDDCCYDGNSHFAIIIIIRILILNIGTLIAIATSQCVFAAMFVTIRIAVMTASRDCYQSYGLRWNIPSTGDTQFAARPPYDE